MSIGLSGHSIQIPIFMNAGPALEAVKAFMGGLGRLAGKIGKTGAAVAAFGAVVGWLAFKQMKKALEETIKFQQEMIGLTKILGQEFSMPIGEALGDLSQTLPVARDELIEVAETAARLGIRGAKNILRFSETMGMMGIATDISATEAADAMARVAKQTDLPVAKLGNLASVINELSNTMATSSSEIVAAVRRSAPELARLGLTADQIAALAATLNTVSESATRSGTRLRRLAQSLSDPGKVGVFASALEMTETKFRDFLAEDPEGAILKIVHAFKEGGQAAETMSSGLDARVRMALAALSQVVEDLEIAFKGANREMEENVSLRAEVDRILGLVVSKQKMLNNLVKEMRRELGEEMLPLYEWLLTYQLKFMKGLNVIIEDPLEGMFSPQRVNEAKDAVRDYLSAIRKEIFRGNMENEELMSGTPLLLDFDKFFLDKTMNSIREENIRGIGLYKDQFLDITDTMMKDVSIGPAEMISRWAQVATIMSQANDAAAENQRLQVSIGELLGDAADRYERAGASSEYILNNLKSSLTGIGVALDLVNKAGVDLAKGVLTEDEIERIVDYETALNDLNAELFERAGIETTLRDQLANDPTYTSYLRDIKVLENQEEALNETQAKRLASMYLYVTEINTLIGLYDAYDVSLQKVIEGENKRLRLTDELTSAMDELNAITELVNEITADMVESDEIDAQYSSMLAFIDGLVHASDEVKENLKEMVRGWHEFMQTAGQDDELSKSLDRLKNRMDFTTLQGRMRLLERIIDGMTDSAIDFFDSLITGSASAGEALINMIKSIGYEIARSFFFKQLLSWIGPEGADWLGLNKMSDAATAVVSTSSNGAGFNGSATGLNVVNSSGSMTFVPNVNNNISASGQRGSDSEQRVVQNHFHITAMDSQDVQRALAKESNFIQQMTVSSFDRQRSTVRRG